jgi:hypothetical protein
MKVCHLAISNGVAGLAHLSTMAVDSAVLVGSATSIVVTCAMVFAGTSLWELEVDAE